MAFYPGKEGSFSIETGINNHHNISVEATGRDLSQKKVIEKIKKLGGDKGNATLLRLEGDILAVFKDYEKRREISDYNINRERASYLIDHFLGFNLVPPTVIREINGNIGALQEYIPDATTLPFVGSGSVPMEEFIKWDLLDTILLKLDRHGQNCLVTKDHHIIVIDNGDCLSEQIVDDTYLPPNLARGALIPEALHRSLVEFTKWKEGKKLLQSLLSELIGETAAEKYMKRIFAVIEAIDKQHFIDEKKFKVSMEKYFAADTVE